MKPGFAKKCANEHKAHPNIKEKKMKGKRKESEISSGFG